MIYLFSTVLLILILATKIAFLYFDGILNPGLFQILSIVVLTLVIIFGTTTFFKERNRIGLKVKSENLQLKFLMIFVGAFIFLSFFINLNREALQWDAVALYDARAKYLMGGVNFTQMVDLMRYDPSNSYYYALYPPFTSLIHYYWNVFGIPVRVGIYYSILLVILAFVVFEFSRKSIGNFLGLLLSFLTISNGIIFSSSISEYTNLPYSLQMFMGVFLLYEHIKNKSSWKLIYGTGLIITTMWIRFLEPLWIGVIIAFIITTLFEYKSLKGLFYSMLMLMYGVIEYLSWQSFVSGFGQVTKIVTLSLDNALKTVIGLFDGSFLSVFLFFVKSWGILLILHLGAVLLQLLKNRRVDFLQLFLILTTLIYFSGLYFVSFQTSWWGDLGGSLVRGSSFMIPISGYFVLKYLYDSKN